MRDMYVDFLDSAWIWLCVGLCLFRRFVVLAFGLVSLAPPCFLQLSSVRLVVVLVPGCCWAPKRLVCLLSLTPAESASSAGTQFAARQILSLILVYKASSHEVQPKMHHEQPKQNILLRTVHMADFSRDLLTLSTPAKTLMENIRHR